MACSAERDNDAISVRAELVEADGAGDCPAMAGCAGAAEVQVAVCQGALHLVQGRESGAAAVGAAGPSIAEKSRPAATGWW